LNTNNSKFEEDNIDKRKSHRESVVIFTDYSISGKFRNDLIKNLSEGGVFIETNEIFEVGEYIVLTYNNPNNNQNVKIGGVVVRKEQNGFGVKFDIEKSKKKTNKEQITVYKEEDVGKCDRCGNTDTLKPLVFFFGKGFYKKLYGGDVVFVCEKCIEKIDKEDYINNGRTISIVFNRFIFLLAIAFFVLPIVFFFGRLVGDEKYLFLSIPIWHVLYAWLISCAIMVILGYCKSLICDVAYWGWATKRDAILKKYKTKKLRAWTENSAKIIFGKNIESLSKELRNGKKLKKSDIDHINELKNTFMD
jgi:Tfp pilus assembly protein PilZ